ncbi:MAG: glycerol-3-phosphate 1-O-acyltransferase PlsY [Burkholderiales bacterium]|nr:glycerol-3-phosphate 1-O-acyltransferase PlsY [Burkholderiales bacterium]
MVETALILVAYLVGSLSFAMIVSRALGLPDPRSYGSGNPGATNVLRTGRRVAAALTLMGDAGKGWLAIVLARAVPPEWNVANWTIAAVALAAFAGHLWPILFRFQGGKGVATAAGVLLALDLRLGIGTVLTWLIVAAIFRVSSLAALAAAVFAPLWCFWLMGLNAITGAIAVIALLLIWRHRANIRRLLSAEERRMGE